MHKFKKGDLWKVRRNDSSLFCVLIILEDTNDRTYLSTRKFYFEGNTIYKETVGKTVIDEFDEKITDPQETAYWLLKFENARNNS